MCSCIWLFGWMFVCLYASMCVCVMLVGLYVCMRVYVFVCGSVDVCAHVFV